MTYTIKITETKSDLAKKLLFYLKSLSDTKEYDFLQITQDEIEDSENQFVKELDTRYEHFLKHYTEYSNWDDIKHKFIK